MTGRASIVVCELLLATLGSLAGSARVGVQMREEPLARGVKGSPVWIAAGRSGASIAVCLARAEGVFLDEDGVVTGPLQEAWPVLSPSTAEGRATYWRKGDMWFVKEGDGEVSSLGAVVPENAIASREGAIVCQLRSSDGMRVFMNRKVYGPFTSVSLPAVSSKSRFVVGGSRAGRALLITAEGEADVGPGAVSSVAFIGDSEDIAFVTSVMSNDGAHTIVHVKAWSSSDYLTTTEPSCDLRGATVAFGAISRENNRDWFVVKSGEILKDRYGWIAGPVRLSDSGKHMAFLGSPVGSSMVSLRLDSKIWAEDESILWFGFVPRTEVLAYMCRNGLDFVVGIGETRFGPFPSIDSIQISAMAKNWAARAQRLEDHRQYIVVNGSPSRFYDSVSQPVFVSNDEAIAAAVSEGIILKLSFAIK